MKMSGITKHKYQVKMKTRYILNGLLAMITLQTVAQNVDDYRRSSVYSIMINHTHKKFAN